MEPLITEAPHRILPPQPQAFITPALVYDQTRLNALATMAAKIQRRTGADILYAVKACPFLDVLQALAPSLQGFAVSSLFEARLIRDLFPGSVLHFTTPGLREDEVDELADLCSYMTFNSESQFLRFANHACDSASVGLRVNTEISNIIDPRYDPARRESKLGVPISRLAEILSSSPYPVSGLHFHTNADSENLLELEDNIAVIAQSISPTDRFEWMNLGGGYLFDKVNDLTPLVRSVEMTTQEIASKVFLEPGSGVSAHGR